GNWRLLELSSVGSATDIVAGPALAPPPLPGAAAGAAPRASTAAMVQATASAHRPALSANAFRRCFRIACSIDRGASENRETGGFIFIRLPFQLGFRSWTP